jgi:hypothetical protein
MGDLFEKRKGIKFFEEARPIHSAKDIRQEVL